MVFMGLLQELKQTNIEMKIRCLLSFHDYKMLESPAEGKHLKECKNCGRMYCWNEGDYLHVGNL